MKRISLRLPDDLHAALVERARREQRSLHNLIVVTLRNANTAPLLAVASAAAALVEANGDAQYDALRAAVEAWRER